MAHNFLQLDMNLPPLRIAVASYDGWVYGWETSDPGDGNSGNNNSAACEEHPQSSSSKARSVDTVDIKYAYESHIGCVKAAALMEATGGTWLATGGMDESIRVYDLRKKKDVGALHSHAGAVTALAFFGKRHLLSGSEDGTLRIWRVRDWVCLHVLGGHTKGICDLAIHPTGKLALSASLDSTLRLWNLMEGRLAFISRLNRPAEKVEFSIDGNYYGLLFRDEVLVYEVSTGDVIAALTHSQTRLQDFCFVEQNYIITGADDGIIRLWSIEDEGVLVLQRECGMKDRIRKLTHISRTRISSEQGGEESMFATVLSSCVVQIWKFGIQSQTKEVDMKKITSITRVARTGSRATALAACGALGEVEGTENRASVPKSSTPSQNRSNDNRQQEKKRQKKKKTKKKKKTRKRKRNDD